MFVSDIDFPADLYHRKDGRFHDCFQDLISFSPRVYSQYLPDQQSPSQNSAQSSSGQQDRRLLRSQDKAASSLQYDGVVDNGTSRRSPASHQQRQRQADLRPDAYASSGQSLFIDNRSIHIQETALSVYTVPDRSPSLVHSLVQLATNVTGIWNSSLRTSHARYGNSVESRPAMDISGAVGCDYVVVPAEQPPTVLVPIPKKQTPTVVVSAHDQSVPTVIIPSLDRQSPTSASRQTGKGQSSQKSDDRSDSDDDDDDGDASENIPTKRSKKKPTSSSKAGSKNPKKQKPATENESDGSGMVISMVIAGASLSMLALYSAFKASEHMGRYEFLGQLHQCMSECEHRLDRTRIWIQERSMLQLDVPRIVLQDTARLSELIESMHRLDTREKEQGVGPAYVGVGISSSFVMAGLLFGGRHSGSLARLGYMGILVSGAYWAFLYGRHSSSMYRDSFVEVARRAHQALSGIGPLEAHASQVLSECCTQVI
ncbi:hypothetical protein BASA50_001150 [Batrachochytrium salamandrivorans]|uniref:Uncharacterized protein n=1 Tax=Batrachochytrium salamandrivorans TaxID=1357716 RepID=A0ABQ8EST2_9FUNG|nr:hypothetical protein BASA60_008817 [Batrachochytrium salamandrivorans]KAH6578051.1 hypothetical protein BASA62_000490 [Batrachochytrium salamandrivorans]KAH6585541.1 hypothetical protein BASA50_001150 [Batrachochytrium salamandrivorans]KAH9248377.1 hypothetical protein BASA81_013963 [Batrachochytrium salamandrivorans]KAH9271391.1 hypothetical protein BASA83_006483 [Batrachochytrium salamandrivorans]